MELYVIFGNQFLSKMNIQAEKLDIIKWLAGINDSRIIKQFMLLKKSNQEMLPISLSQGEKDAIDKGLKSLNEGHLTSHEEVKEITQKKYPHLFK
jgi:predicted transcriptional regulator